MQSALRGTQCINTKSRSDQSPRKDAEGGRLRLRQFGGPQDMDDRRHPQPRLFGLDRNEDFVEPGGRIDVTASSDGETICIRISDQGIGIAPEALEHVKKRFFKADCSRRGNGIGLAMADEIVALHGGQLLIESELGIGTTVELRLPVHQQEDRPTPPNRSGQTIIEIE